MAMGRTSDPFTMTIAARRGWMDSAAGSGDATHPERYAITVVDGYVGLAGTDEHIQTVSDPSQAWVFHTHEKAVLTARQLTSIRGRLHEVVRLR